MALSHIPSPEPLSGHNRAARVQRLLEPKILGPLVGALAVGLGLLAIYHLHGHIHPGEVRAALAATSGSRLALALGFACLSLAALTCYDLVAAHRVAPRRIPLRLAALAGFIAYGFSNALGFHVFLGGTLRYRIYQSVGVDASDVGNIIGLSLLTAWSGMASVIGLALLLDPAHIPLLQRFSPGANHLLGVLILLALAALLVRLGTNGRRVRILGWEFPLPTAPQALLQLAVGAVDYGASAAVLWVLLPADITPAFSIFLILFIAALLAGLISHAPGGLGVFDATILIGLGAGTRADVVAALLVFRLVYYVLPLVLAALALLVFEVRRQRTRMPAITGRTLRIARRLAPSLSAVLVFLSGLLLLASGSTPNLPERTQWLVATVPLPFAEASHLLASVVGLLLVVVARGLYRRLAAAHGLAIALLLASVVFSLLKGGDWDNALILLVEAAVLAACRPAFYRGGGWRVFRLDATWVALVLIVVMATLTIGLVAYRHVEYRPELWWRFAWQGDASRFLRAMLALAVVAAALAMDALINRPRPVPPGTDGTVPDAVRRILGTSTDTASCVALLGDKSFLVSPDEDAFLMYGVSGRSWIAMGDPVGNPEAGKALCWRFAEAADHAGARAMFYAVQPAFLPIYLEMNLALLKIGEVARVDLVDFSLAGPARSGLRQAFNRADREALVFSVIPSAEVGAALPELRGVSDAWLAGKHGHEKGFSLGRFDPDYLRAFDCAVLRKEGHIVAFANLWRSGDGQELAVDLMRYRPGVSKVLMDALFTHLFLYGSAQGYRWFNLGAAPLSGLSGHPLASTWEHMGTFIYRRGDEFYNFSGLRAFKQKFDPVWTPQYLACPGGLWLTHALANVTVLIAGGPMGLFRC